MPSWRGKLQPNEIVLMAAYVASLRGKNLAGKAIEPDKDKLIPPWPKSAEVSPSDATKAGAPSK